MDALIKEYCFDKSIVLNAVYDALEIMKFRIEKADSDLGIIIATKFFSGKGKNPVSFLINLSMSGEIKTVIRISAKNKDDNETRECMHELMDQISLILAMALKN